MLIQRVAQEEEERRKKEKELHDAEIALDALVRKV
jgi:hypothetical protein